MVVAIMGPKPAVHRNVAKYWTPGYFLRGTPMSSEKPMAVTMDQNWRKMARRFHLSEKFREIGGAHGGDEAEDVSCMVRPGLFTQPHSHSRGTLNSTDWDLFQWPSAAMMDGRNRLPLYSGSAAPMYIKTRTIIFQSLKVCLTTRQLRVPS